MKTERELLLKCSAPSFSGVCAMLYSQPVDDPSINYTCYINGSLPEAKLRERSLGYAYNLPPTHSKYSVNHFSRFDFFEIDIGTSYCLRKWSPEREQERRQWSLFHVLFQKESLNVKLLWNPWWSIEYVHRRQYQSRTYVFKVFPDFVFQTCRRVSLTLTSHVHRLEQRDLAEE